MANETWIPVTTTYIETRTQDERKYGVTAIIYCDEPLDIAICRRVEESRYPELDASVEAGDELDRWKERCHALETRLADFAQELHRQTMLAEYRKVLINESKAENVRLRELLPDTETLRAGDRLGAVVTNTIMTPDDYADLTMIRKWLKRLETRP